MKRSFRRLAVSAPDDHVKVVRLLAPAPVRLAPASVAGKSETATRSPVLWLAKLGVGSEIPGDDDAVYVHLDHVASRSPYRIFESTLR